MKSTILCLLCLSFSMLASAADENQFLEKLISPEPGTSEKMLETSEAVDPTGGIYHSDESDAEFFLNCIKRNQEHCEKSHLMVKYNEKHYILARTVYPGTEFVPMLIEVSKEAQIKLAYKNRSLYEKRNKVALNKGHLRNPFAATIVTLFKIQDHFLYIFGLPFAFTFDVLKTPVIGGVILPINSIRLAASHKRAINQMVYLFNPEAKEDIKETKRLNEIIVTFLRIDQFTPVF